MSNNYEGFHQIYKQFLKQNNYVDPFGLNIVSPQFMRKYGILFIAENQGEILGWNLYFHDKNNVLLLESAYNVETTIENKKKSADANCYLHWEAMQYFKNMDIIFYDLGDVSSDDIHIHHHMNGGEYFKRCFGGDVIPRYAYMKFHSHFSKVLFHGWNFLRSFP